MPYRYDIIKGCETALILFHDYAGPDPAGQVSCSLSLILSDDWEET